MGRKPNVYWHKNAKCYASSSGIYEDGRRGKMLLFRGIPREDEAAAKAALDAYHEAWRISSSQPDAPGGIDPAESRQAEPKAEDSGWTEDTQDDAELTVRRLTRAYLEASELTNSPRTVQGVREILKSFCNFIPAKSNIPFGQRLARDITAIHLIQMRRAWETEQYSASYRSRLIRTVKACWAWGSATDPERTPERLLSSNPLKDVKGVHVPQSPERYAERRELAEFLRFAWRRTETMTPVHRRFGRLFILALRVFVHTGARPGEICAARWTDFDQLKERILLAPHRHKTGRKTGKNRQIELPPLMVRAIVREQRRDHHPTYIFTHKRGKGARTRGASLEHGEPWNSQAFGRALKGIRDEAIAAGIKLAAKGPNAFTVYRLRHTFASDAIMEGIPTSVVAAMMGTSERVLSQTYCHIMDPRLKEAAQQMVRARRRPKGRR